MRTCVIKVGSGVIAPGGKLDRDTVHRLAFEIAVEHSKGVHVVLVSSGAVACGLSRLGLDRMPERLSERQAAAALGQPKVIGAWVNELEEAGLDAAQVLLTADDIDYRERFVNAQKKIHTLLDLGAIPIINENDAVAFKGTSMGDNDRVGALATCLLGADLFVMLSTADGVREEGGHGRVIPVVESPGQVLGHIGATKSDVGTGGMASKLQSAFTAADMGADVIIASGSEPGVLALAFAGEPVGTRIPAARGGLTDVTRRKQWIAHAIRIKGRIVVDDGARAALVDKGASLLPGGVVRVEPNDPAGFPAGAAVEICDQSGKCFARGLTVYRSDEIQRVAGKQSGDIESTIGRWDGSEVIHRDDLVVY